MKIKNKELLTIGEISKISCISVSALRYYDEEGIIKPVYINPDSSYRYYSLDQVQKLTFIKIATSLQIPLKEFKNFFDDNNGIDYETLLNYGELVAQEKLTEISKKLSFIQRIKTDIKAAKEIEILNGNRIINLPEKQFFVLPYQPNEEPAHFYKKLGEVMQKTIESGYEPFAEWGLMYKFQPKGEVQRFIFTEIITSNKIDENIITIPEGEFLSTFIKGSLIEKAPEIFPNHFQELKEILIIETEAYELRNSNNEVGLFAIRLRL